MDVTQAVILGIVQGLTEFLPVSSSGHLVLAQHLLGVKEPMLTFDVALHAGTLLAVFVYFHRDIRDIITETWSYLRRLPKDSDKANLIDEYPMALAASLVVLAMIPTVGIAIAFKDMFETMFDSLIGAGIGWIIMGALLILSRRCQQGTRTLYEMNHQDAFVIGIMQGIAIIPSISRSGLTIIASMAMGIEKKAAARFSFLLSIPAILGAMVMELKNGIQFFHEYPQPLIAGFAASAVLGYLSIFFLLRLIAKGNFFIFGFYCVLAGLFTLAVSFFG